MSKPLPYKDCYAHGCKTQIPSRFLMCGRHWAMVPKATQDLVYETLHAWKGDGTARPYIIATLKAKIAVCNREGRIADVLDLETQIRSLGEPAQ